MMQNQTLMTSLLISVGCRIKIIQGLKEALLSSASDVYMKTNETHREKRNRKTSNKDVQIITVQQPEHQYGV